MPYVTSNDLNLYYELYGEGESIIFINGLKTDHTRWFKLRDLLKDKFQIIVFDNRATGRSRDSGLAFDIRTMAEDVKNLMACLKLDSAYIAGHSMGGAVAQKFAYYYPEKVKKLFLLNTFLRLNNSAKAGFYELLKLHENNGTSEEIVEAMIPWGFSSEFVTPEVKEVILAASKINPYPQSAKDYKRQYQALIDFDSSNWIHHIQVPTYVIGSEKDITALPDESELLSKLIPKAEFFMLPGGHASAVEQPQRLANFFIEKLKPSRNLIGNS